MDFYFCSIYKRFSVSLDVTVFTCILFTFCSIIISRTVSHLITDFGLNHSGDGHTPPDHTALKTDWFVGYPCWFSTEQFTFHTFKLILNSAFHFCISFTGCINYRLHTLHHLLQFRLTLCTTCFCESAIMSNQCLPPQKRMAACRGLMLYGLLLSGPYFAHHCLGTVEE